MEEQLTLQAAPATKKENLVYMPQLDGVRAFAIVFVIASHWFVPFTTTGFIPYGELGVMMFFVLSGFLITSILLRYKESIRKKKGSTSFFIGIFFMRRALRILPIYYLTILLILLISPQIFEGAVWWHCAYLSNFYFVLVRHSFQQPISQWWTLSVEEQFYLVWPFLILLVNNKYLTTCIIIIILIAPVFRQFNTIHTYMYKYLTPSCFDSLGAGALLALHYTKFEKFFTPARSLLLFCISVAGFIAYTRFRLPLYDALDRVFLSLFSLVVIFQASKGFKGIIGMILSNPAVIFIGKISYGLYIYHKIIPRFNLHIDSIAGLQLTRILILLAISVVSYYLIEKPILRLKPNVQ